MKQQHWVSTRKKLLRKIKAQVLNRLGPAPASFRQYAKKLNREFRGRWQGTDGEQLLQSVLSSRVVFGSDFHAHAQSQRAHVRILRALPDATDVILALECVCREDMPIVEAYFSNQISESELLEKMDWEKTWGFPWENYRPLFELAKRRGWGVFGLSRRADFKKASPLARRDVRMANEIEELTIDHPEALVYVLVGELHLAKNHLPEAFDGLQPSIPSIVIHQDAEDLYFRLVRRAEDQNIEVLRSGNRYCLMVSPPWVKWQSYLTFLEQTYDRDLDEDGTGIDQSDHVKNLIEVLANDFSLTVSTADLQVYTPESREAFRHFKKQLPKAEWPLLRYHLDNNRSFLLPSAGLVYLSSSTLNRAAAMAGKFLHARLSGRKTTLWQNGKHFEALIWIETIAFFFSKWINPKRKSETLTTIKVQLEMLSPRDHGREALLLALDQRLSDVLLASTGRRRPTRFRARKKTSVLESARILGTMLGEALFVAVRSGKISQDEIREWLLFPVDVTDFASFYAALVKRLK